MEHWLVVDKRRLLELAGYPYVCYIRYLKCFIYYKIVHSMEQLINRWRITYMMLNIDRQNEIHSLFQYTFIMLINIFVKSLVYINNSNALCWYINLWQKAMVSVTINLQYGPRETKCLKPVHVHAITINKTDKKSSKNIKHPQRKKKH